MDVIAAMLSDLIPFEVSAIKELGCLAGGFDFVVDVEVTKAVCDVVPFRVLTVIKLLWFAGGFDFMLSFLFAFAFDCRDRCEADLKDSLLFRGEEHLFKCFFSFTLSSTTVVAVRDIGSFGVLFREE